MTDIPITANERKAQFTGNTGLGPFAFTFNVLVSGDLRVLKNNVALTINTEYTVSLNVDGTGSVTLTGSGNGTALIASDVLTIIGNRQLARTSDYVQGGNLFAGALNEDLDSIVIMMQQIDEKVSRTMRIDAGDVGDNLLLPSQSTRASKYLAFDSSGDPVAVSGTTSTIVVSSYMEDLLLTTDSASAFAYLGVTATASELNTLDGVTASTAEINLLDGVTWTLTDLNTITTAGKALLDDADAAAQRTTLGLGDIATTDLIDEDSMATDSATRAPSQQSVKAYVDAGDANQIGVGQTWQTVTRSANTSYQNTTGKPIMVAITGAFNGAFAEVSTDNSTWVTIWQPGNNQVNTASFIVPDNHYYRVGSGGGSLTLWRELR